VKEGILNISFNGKVAFVTGAASGIGLACAELLAAGGAKVALADVQKGNLAKATKLVQGKGIAKGYSLDVTDVKAISSTVSKIRKDLGEIDILVCCAGLGPPPGESILESDWDRIVDVNSKGLFFCNQEVAVKCMLPRKKGSIVNIASITGMIGIPSPFVGAAHYHASKGAVIALTRQVAMEWAPKHVRVNGVAPGFVVTPMTQGLWKDKVASARAKEWTPLGGFCGVDDIANAVCFLASDKAKMITGVTLPVDGGWTAR
jgi:NAD(P)-dependent dehydrogenase (short-subunit alcohol dehydrogenase family)